MIANVLEVGLILAADLFNRWIELNIRICSMYNFGMLWILERILVLHHSGQSGF